MRRRTLPPLALTLALLPASASATPPPPFSTLEIEGAARDFAAARAASDRDGGRLWGQPLYGPILLVDPENRRILANQADAEGKLKPGTGANPGVYRGQYPEDQAIANTAVEWAGVRWAMILLPLPEEPVTKLELMEHELFHRLQPALGLPLFSTTIAHLDGLEGRTWLRLEWLALRAALEAPRSGDGTVLAPPVRQALEDALVFRARRRALFPAGGEEERALEMNEGLAEDTGCALAASDAAARRQLALGFLAKGEKRPSFARSFAYASGPAYGYLLDERAAGWRKGLDGKGDLGTILARAIGFVPPRATALEGEANKRASRYGGEAIRAAEQERETKRLERVALSRRLLVDGPVLTLPLRQPQVSFDPNVLEPLEGLGTVYRKLEVAEAWGTLAVEGGAGALLANDWSLVTLPAPADLAVRPLQGEGWSLQLKDGWKAEPGKRKGDWVVVEGR